MPASALRTVSLVVVCAISFSTFRNIAQDSRPVRSASEISVQYGSRAFGNQALMLPLWAPLRGVPRVGLVQRFRALDRRFAEMRGYRFGPMLRDLSDVASVAARALLMTLIPGAMVMMASEPDDLPIPPIDKVSALLLQLGEPSGPQFTKTEARVLSEIQKGERVAARIAERLRLSGERVRQVTSAIAWKLEREKERRDRDSRGVPFEDRPLADLHLAWPLEWRLNEYGIQTVGQLLQRSDADLVRLRGIGVRRLKNIKERLWVEGRRTLRESLPPESPSSGVSLSRVKLLLPIDWTGIELQDMFVQPERIYYAAAALSIAASVFIAERHAQNLSKSAALIRRAA